MWRELEARELEDVLLEAAPLLSLVAHPVEVLLWEVQGRREATLKKVVAVEDREVALAPLQV